MSTMAALEYVRRFGLEPHPDPDHGHVLTDGTVREHFDLEGFSVEVETSPSGEASIRVFGTAYASPGFVVMNPDQPIDMDESVNGWFDALCAAGEEQATR